MSLSLSPSIYIPYLTLSIWHNMLLDLLTPWAYMTLIALTGMPALIIAILMDMLKMRTWFVVCRKVQWIHRECQAAKGKVSRADGRRHIEIVRAATL